VIDALSFVTACHMHSAVYVMAWCLSVCLKLMFCPND